MVLSLSRDDALALSRAIGQDVSLVLANGEAWVGTVDNVDASGRLRLTNATDLSGMMPFPLSIPMNEVLAWSPVKPKGGHK